MGSESVHVPFNKLSQLVFLKPFLLHDDLHLFCHSSKLSFKSTLVVLVAFGPAALLFQSTSLLPLFLTIFGALWPRSCVLTDETILSRGTPSSLLSTCFSSFSDFGDWIWSAPTVLTSSDFHHPVAWSDHQFDGFFHAFDHPQVC